MRVDEAVRKRFQELYSAGGSKVWVYSHRDGSLQYWAGAYDAEPPKYHRLFNGYSLVGELNLVTGHYGTEHSVHEKFSKMMWPVLLLQLFIKVVQLAFLVTAAGLAMFIMIIVNIGRGSRQ